MNVTELPVTGYDGDEAVFAVNLAPDAATVALTCKDDNGGIIAGGVTRQPTTLAFYQVLKALEQLPIVPVRP